ncbi:hypothetical protein PMZ80_007960 [Knufia obscura]|uniref:RING-type domain-containing protein n=2 Tax=Knufia TaxID=430999 RepID=A0AAN8ERV7_9EURO|nr:hypothetical protein PMZ80_007960 [Knufia obscura]KAK5957312.1 hypothetical protein OHC33_001684 [Knufia fluminis]
MGNSQSNIRGARVGQAEDTQDLHNGSAQHHHQPNVSTPPSASAFDQVRSPTRSMFSNSRHSILSESWRRQSQRLSLDADTALNDRPFDQIDERPYDTEDRPLFHSNHDPPVEPHAERPPNWRHSTMSRLGSRLLPDSVARGLTNSGEETAEEGHALRSGLSSRIRPSPYQQVIGQPDMEPHSGTSPFRRRTTDRRRESTRGSVRRLFSSNTEPYPSQIRSYPRIRRPNTLDSADILQDDSQSIRSLPRRSGTRLDRVRHSLSSSVGSLLGVSGRLSNRRLHSPPLRPSRAALAEDSDELLSRPNLADHRHEAEDGSPHELDAVEPETRNLLSSSRITSGMSTIRRFHGLRSRSTRLIRRGEHPPLSQVLQLAAAAIAAQLSGTTINAVDGSHPNGEAFDGSIQNFVQTLQEAASAQAGQNIDLNASEGDLPPVNFMRVFQFPNDENGTPMAARPNSQPMTGPNDNHEVGSLDRSVTLVLVGVRSMPNIHDGSPNENGTLGPSLDTLLSLPFLPPANVLRNGSSGALFRRSDTRVRQQNRRHSMTNFNFPQQYESQRHTRARAGTRTSVENGLLTPMSESPPGPVPPPSTPADLRSGHATPNRRPSSASAAHAPGLPDLNEDQDNYSAPLPAESAFNTARQRRRSDSEFARRPELSSGNSRRNGVVEPDRPHTGAGRSWLIYVVGTNVSPDHPAFTMPSLFTDNPSYEDMQMLSTLLGPVKPPVATSSDVEAAGGLYRVVLRGSTLVAEAVRDDQGIVTVHLGERCLICLCDYEQEEQVRQIDTCKHVYHRECIDEWLTTGRNSCPMCRGQGVKETASTPNSTNSNIAPQQAEQTP